MAVAELALMAKTWDHPSNLLAIQAAEKLSGCGIKPRDLTGVAPGITDQFARHLISRQLLPETEFNDGLILAESSLMGN